MLLNEIVRKVNNKLAGELLTFEELRDHLDATIDDINARLDSTYPSFSEFYEQYTQEPDYNFFPDKYIRSVVVPGAAFYFFIVDEEGADVAPQYAHEYDRNLFYMERDYISKVPEEYQADSSGGLSSDPTYGVPSYYRQMFY